MSHVSNPKCAFFAVLFGKWTDHVKSWKLAKIADRILFLTYEEMVQVKQLILKKNVLSVSTTHSYKLGVDKGSLHLNNLLDKIKILYRSQSGKFGCCSIRLINKTNSE